MSAHIYPEPLALSILACKSMSHQFLLLLVAHLKQVVRSLERRLYNRVDKLRIHGGHLSVWDTH